MARRKVSTSVYLDPEQVNELRARTQRTGEPYAAIIRRAIDRELRPSPISRLEALVHAPGGAEFLDNLSPLESVVFAGMVGL